MENWVGKRKAAWSTQGVNAGDVGEPWEHRGVGVAGKSWEKVRRSVFVREK